MKKITLMCAALLAAMGMNAQETTPLTAAMWHQWEGATEEGTVYGTNVTIVENSEVTFEDNIGTELKGGGLVLGNATCYADLFADLTEYGGIEVQGTANVSVRFYFNRKADPNGEKPMEGPGIDHYLALDKDGKATLMFADVKGLKDFVHLNFVKFPWGLGEGVETAVITSINLLPKSESDEPEIPVDPLAITGDWFHQWNGFDASATITNEYPSVDDNIGKEFTGGSLLLGTGIVAGDIYADLTKYAGIEAEGTPGLRLRLLFNRPTQNEGITECNPEFDENGKFTFMFTEVKDGENPATFIHLNAVKTYGMGDASYKVTKFNVIEKTSTAVESIESAESSVLYNVYGQRVDDSYRGIVIKNGKKFIKK